MSKYQGKSTKELIRLLEESDKKIAEGRKACLRISEESSNVQNKLVVTIKDLEETLAKKDQIIEDFGKFLDEARRQAAKAEGTVSGLRGDLEYERERRAFAENKLHTAERAMMEVSSHNGIQEHKIAMQKVGIRVDRHGSAS